MSKKDQKEVKHYQDLPNIEGMFTFPMGGKYRFCYSQQTGQLIEVNDLCDHYFNTRPAMITRREFLGWKDIINLWLTRKTKTEIEKMLMLLIRDNKRSFLADRVTTMFRTIRQSAAQSEDGEARVVDLTFNFILRSPNN